MLYSSGDNGVAGGNGLCLNGEGFLYLLTLLILIGNVTLSGTRFNPGFLVGNDHSSHNNISMCFIGYLSIHYCSGGHPDQSGINH